MACKENRLVSSKILDSNPKLLEKLLEKWVIDYGYTNAFGDDSALLICLISEL